MVHGLAVQRSKSTKRTRSLAWPIAVAVMVAAPSAAMAQHPPFGAKVGPSFTGTELAEDDGQTYHPRIAAAGGGFVMLPLTSRIAFQVEAMSSPKGTRLEEENTNLAQTLMLRYFELPILARLAGPTTGVGVPYFLAGPLFGVRTSAKAQVSTLAGSLVAGVKEDARDAIERFEAGLIVGAGLDIGRRLLVEGRYSHGLTNVNKVSGATRFTNRGVSFLTGFRF
jgi:hypothetical protein